MEVDRSTLGANIRSIWVGSLRGGAPARCQRVRIYRLIGSAKQPKSSKNASGVPGMSKCGLKVATGDERGGKVLQKVPKR